MAEFFSKRVPYVPVGAFLAATVIVTAFGYRYYVAQRDLVEADVRDQLLTIADMKVEQLSTWRRERLGIARSIMADAMAIGAVERLLTGSGAESDQLHVLSWLTALCEHLHFVNAILADRSGKPVIVVGRMLGNEAHLVTLSQRVLRADDVVEQDFRPEGPGGPVHLGYNLPLGCVNK